MIKIMPIINKTSTSSVSHKIDYQPWGVGPNSKDPQLSKSLNALKLVVKSDWNVFDFSNDDFKEILNKKFLHLEVRCLKKLAPQHCL